jgi:hypothetical protein
MSFGHMRDVDVEEQMVDGVEIKQILVVDVELL